MSREYWLKAKREWTESLVGFCFLTPFMTTLFLQYSGELVGMRWIGGSVAVLGGFLIALCWFARENAQNALDRFHTTGGQDNG